MKRFLIVLAILIAAVFLYFYFQKAQETPPISPAVPAEPNAVPVFSNLGDCGKVSDSNMQVYCYNVIALKNLDSSLCGKNTESLVRDWCYYTIGVKLGNGDLCGKILDSKLREDCKWETT